MPRGFVRLEVVNRPGHEMDYLDQRPGVELRGANKNDFVGRPRGWQLFHVWRTLSRRSTRAVSHYRWCVRMLYRERLRWLSVCPFLLLFGRMAGLLSAAEIVVQRGHDVEVSAAVYSADGRILASAGEAEAIRLWDRESGDLIGTLPGHSQRIVGLAFSADGKWLASSSTDGTVKLWDYRAGKEARLFNEHVGNWARRVAFSADSRLVTAATYDGTVSVWDVASGAVVRTLPTGSRIGDVLFTPDGRFVVTASREVKSALIQFWNIATGAPGLKLDHGNPMSCIAISHDGRVLASGGPNGVVNLWELPSGRLLRRVEMPDQDGAYDIDLNADGTRMATSGHWVNRIWDTASGALQCEMRGHEDGCVQISFSPDGGEVATASSDASVRLWNARDGAVKRVFARRPPNTPVTSLAFSADGKYEALGSANGMVRVWDARDGSFKYDLRGHEGAVHALAFSADAAWLMSGSADRTMRVWDMAHGTISTIHPLFDRVDAIGALSVGGTQGLSAAASGPFAAGGLDHTIKLWQSHSDRPVRVLEGHTANVHSVALAPGVDLLASASADGTVKLWNPRNGECLLTQPNATPVDILAFSPDARWLAAGLADGTVRVLDPKTLATLREWRADQRPVQSLAISYDGRWIATGSGDGTVIVWDSATGDEVRRFTGITSQFLPLAFHPKLPVLAFAQQDDTVVHANVETGEILFQRVLFSDGEWLTWNPAKMFYMASPHGDEHARVRFSGQLVPVYPLELYRRELRRDALTAFAAPAPLLAPKDFARWWLRYPYKRAWLYGGLAVALAWVGVRLRKGWIAERRRRAQEHVSRQLFALQEAERKRIAAELHDSLGQNLLIIKNRLYLAQREFTDSAPGAQLGEISESVSQTIQEVREISHNLRPYQLDRLGLTKAVQAVVKKVADSGAVAIDSAIAPIDGLFPPEGEIQFYRVVQESLNNILKHSDAATARLSIERVDGKVTMKIEDDGRGFDYRATMSDTAYSRGFGLTGLGERVRMLGGRFDCDSAPGEGTRLTFEIPLPPKHEKAD